MLVVFVTLLVSTVAVPSFLRSARGARLRASARTVVMAHRYARSFSVLRQKPTALLFDTEKQSVELVSVGLRGGLDERSRFLEDRAQAALQEPEQPMQGVVESEMVRELQPGVRIASFRSDKEGQVHEGIYWVNYYPNGMCDAYELDLADEKNNRLSIEVAAHSGRVRVRDE